MSFQTPAQAGQPAGLASSLPPSLSPEDQAAIERLSQSPHITLTLAVTLVLHAWPDLSIAVREGFGGPDSSDKRDWMCGEIAEMVRIPEGPIPVPTKPLSAAEMDANKEEDLDLVDDLVEQLDHMITSEFETEIEADDAVYNVAKEIVAFRRRLLCGDASVTVQVYHQYQLWKSRKGAAAPQIVRVSNPDDDSSGDDNDDDGSEDDDTNANGQPESSSASRARSKKEDEDVDMVDEDGFTTVRRKGRR